MFREEGVGGGGVNGRHEVELAEALYGLLDRRGGVPLVRGRPQQRLHLFVPEALERRLALAAAVRLEQARTLALHLVALEHLDEAGERRAGLRNDAVVEAGALRRDLVQVRRHAAVEEAAQGDVARVASEVGDIPVDPPAREREERTLECGISASASSFSYLTASN